MQADFDALRAFNFGNSTVLLWVFKKNTTALKYKALHVPIDPALKGSLIQFIQGEMNRISEFSPYSHISQTNENSCLSANEVGTDFGALKALVDRPEPENVLSGIADLKGVDGYVVKYSNEAGTVYAVKRSTTSWKAAYSKKFINMIFRNGELSAIENNAFSIERNFDFYCFNSTLFIANKRGFESTLRYNSGYVTAFTSLQTAPAFSSLFTNLQPLVQYVGSNSMHLRRMATIEEKNLYNQPGFITRFQAVSTQRNWGINFDPQTGRIIPCAQTAKVIMQVLLDHRLVSEITNSTYDVPDAVRV